MKYGRLLSASLIGCLIFSSAMAKQQLVDHVESYYYAMCARMSGELAILATQCSPQLTLQATQPTSSCMAMDTLQQEYNRVCSEKTLTQNKVRLFHGLVQMHFYLFADNNYTRQYHKRYNLSQSDFSRYLNYADYITQLYLLASKAQRAEIHNSIASMTAFVRQVLNDDPMLLKTQVGPKASFEDWYQLFMTVHQHSKPIRRLKQQRVKQTQIKKKIAHHRNLLAKNQYKQTTRQIGAPKRKPIFEAGAKFDWDLVHKSRSSSFENKRFSRGYIGLAEASIGFNPASWLSSTADWTYAQSVEVGSKGAKVTLDQASVTLGDLYKFPFYLTLGKTYFPFGAYVPFSFFGTLNQNMSGFHETGALLGFSKGPGYAAVFTMANTGKVNSDSDSHWPTVDNFGFEVGATSLAGEQNYGYHVQFSFVSRYEESNTLSALFPINLDEVGAIALHFAYHYHRIGFISDYLSTVKAYNQSAFSFNGSGAEPSAWTNQLYYNFRLARFPSTLALSYGISRDALALSQPKSLWMLSYATDFNRYVGIEAFYSYGRDYGTGDTSSLVTRTGTLNRQGTGRSINTVGLRLSLAVGEEHPDFPQTN